MRALSLLACCLVLAIAARPAPRPRFDALPADVPRVWLWAWERPEDLRFLAGRRDVGVAFLARTVVVGSSRVEVHRRRQPVLVPEGVPRAAVVRVEVRRGATGIEAHVAATADAIAGALEGTGASALQIDFDAPPSSHAFYRAIVAAVRPRAPLSVTAIASWCLREGAMPDLGPVDVVPMFFAMGEGTARARIALAAQGDFPVAACRGAIGVAMEEPSPRLGGRPVWAFQRRAWTAADVKALIEREST
jgi:hypothetical protein